MLGGGGGGIQRMKLIDDTQERLLELLEELATSRSYCTSVCFGGWGGGGIGLDIGWGGVGRGGAKDQAGRQNTGEVAGTGGTHHK